MAEITGARAEWAMLKALVGTGFVCAVVIVTAYELTRAPIAAHRIERLRGAIEQVLPGTETVRSYRRLASGGFERLPRLRGGEDVVHAGYDASGRLLGFAIEGRGPGYQDTIELMFGYEPRRERIVGLTVLASRETPGLGDRIRVDRDFLASFRDLEARLDEHGHLAHPIAVARRGEARQEWQIDGISGATVSSRAVARIVSASAEAWLPALRTELEAFRE